MQRAIIRQIGSDVHLLVKGHDGRSIVDEKFYIDGNEGLLKRRSDGQECCDTLFGSRGGTMPTTRDTMLSLVRREWKRSRKAIVHHVEQHGLGFW